MIYLVVLLLAFGCSLVYDQYKPQVHFSRGNIGVGKDIWSYLIIIAIILIIGFRADTIGLDTGNYSREFAETPPLDLLNDSFVKGSRYQAGFIYFFAWIKDFTEEFYVVQLIHATFINLVLLWFFRKNGAQYLFMSLSYYIVINFLEFNTEILRESIAVSFGLISLYSYSRRKYFFAIVCLYLAFNFHISSIILLIFPLLSKIHYSKRNLIIFLALETLSLIGYAVLSKYTTAIAAIIGAYVPQLNDMVAIYQSTEINSKLNIFYFISLFVRNLIIPVTAMLILKDRGNKYIGFVMAYCILMTISAYTYAFYRFANYMAPFNILFLAEITIYLMYRYRRIKYFVALCLLVFILYANQNKLFNKGLDGMYMHERYFPYKSIFQ